MINKGRVMRSREYEKLLQKVGYYKQDSSDRKEEIAAGNNAG